MGAILPFIGYMSKSALQDGARRIERDQQSTNLINRFVDVVSHRDIRAAVKSSRGFLYNPDKVNANKWLQSIIVEDDIDSRPLLRKVLEDNERSFTLLVPSISHIMDGNMHDATALRLLVDGCIAVIDAGQAILNHGNDLGHIPANGLTRWITSIRKEYMIDREALTRSCLRRFGALELR